MTAWRREIRRWARELGATHALIEGAGYPAVLTIGSILDRIITAHGDTPVGEVRCIVDAVARERSTVRISRAGRTAMIIADPQAKVVRRIEIPTAGGVRVTEEPALKPITGEKP
ncbi:MAG: hypothetical protein QM662_19235 [Gordonia sp. (in: high G+C Gram-positive bacteria)]